uniref:Protein E6 n=1 Tax=Human papillomavirus 23 TaxID=37955 RepID=A0A1V0CLX5_HPV23|nr:transforming protein E6 [Human papillomavirus 23]
MQTVHYLSRMCYTKLLMDSRRPLTVQQLSDKLTVPVVDLLLPCRFCSRFLTYLELREFDYKNLQLIWTEEDFVFACCSGCAYASAQFEIQQFYQLTVYGREIEQEEQRPIGQICIRCQYCLKSLDLIEKLDICCFNQPFHKVRNHWKGRCRHCKEIE